MFGLTKGMVWPIILFFLIWIGSVILVGIVASSLGAKCKRKYSLADIFLGITLVPFIEEIIFRGPVYWLGEPSPASWTVLIVWGGAIFGLLHGVVKEEEYEEINRGGVIAKIISATIGGTLLGIIVMRTRSLAPAMIVHTLFNALGSVLIGISRSLRRL